VPEPEPAPAPLQYVVAVGRPGEEEVGPLPPPDPHLAGAAGAGVFDRPDVRWAEPLLGKLLPKDRQFDLCSLPVELPDLDDLPGQDRRIPEGQGLVRLSVARAERLALERLDLGRPDGVGEDSIHPGWAGLAVHLEPRPQPRAG